MRYAYYLDLSTACPKLHAELGLIELTEEQALTLSLAGLTMRSHRNLVEMVDVTIYEGE